MKQQVNIFNTTSGNIIKPVVPQHISGGWQTNIPTHTSGNIIKLPQFK